MVSHLGFRAAKAAKERLSVRRLPELERPSAAVGGDLSSVSELSQAVGGAGMTVSQDEMQLQVLAEIRLHSSLSNYT